MMQWFGLDEFAPMCAELPRVPVPIGEPCCWCEESILSTDNGLYYANADSRPIHHECFVRQIVGSVAHQQHRCTCYGGHEDDESIGRMRVGAIAAYAYWCQHWQQS